MAVSQFEYLNGELHAEAVPLARVAERYGTPCYVYSRAAVTETYRAFDTAFAGRDHLGLLLLQAGLHLGGALLELIERLAVEDGRGPAGLVAGVRGGRAGQDDPRREHRDDGDHHVPSRPTTGAPPGARDHRPPLRSGVTSQDGVPHQGEWCRGGPSAAIRDGLIPRSGDLS